jgi:hypothetical protein
MMVASLHVCKYPRSDLSTDARCYDLEAGGRHRELLHYLDGAGGRGLLYKRARLIVVSREQFC